MDRDKQAFSAGGSIHFVPAAAVVAVKNRRDRCGNGKKMMG